MRLVKQRRLYALVRKDLSVAQRAVQASHAIAEFLLRGPKTEWDNGTIVILGVKDEGELRTWATWLEVKRTPYTAFREPDIGNQMTALATVDGGNVFHRLALLEG